MPGWRGVGLVVSVCIVACVLYLPNDQPEFNFTQVDWGNFSLTEEQVLRYRSDGFLVVRGAFPRSVVEAIGDHRPRNFLPGFLYPLEYLLESFFQQVQAQDSLWMDYKFFNDFWHTSPAARIISQVLPQHANDFVFRDLSPPTSTTKHTPNNTARATSSVRLLADLVVGFRKQHKPIVIGAYHQDTYSYGLVDDQDDGISLWIPLMDIDQEANGASVWLVNMTRVPKQCRQCANNTSYSYLPECYPIFDKERHVADWRLGDLLLFSRTVIHKSQPMKPNSTMQERFSLVGRFISGHARINVELQGQALKFKNNYCKHGLKQGDVFNSACFPLLYPKALPNETAIRDNHQLGVPSNAVWLSQEVYRIIINGMIFKALGF
eukprot:m.38292 g.38292  ORF g.38292 m.38292 type:complete len:378 (-) comp16453_c0_seq1:255-1388(-)